MTNLPERAKSRRLLKSSNLSTGTKLIGFGAGLFVVTRIIVWLPLGFIGTWINGLLWPVLVLSILAGAGLSYLKAKRSPQSRPGV